MEFPGGTWAVNSRGNGGAVAALTAPSAPGATLGALVPRAERGAVAHGAGRPRSQGAARGATVVDKAIYPGGAKGQRASEGQRGQLRLRLPSQRAHGVHAARGISVEEGDGDPDAAAGGRAEQRKGELALCQVSKWPPAFPPPGGAGAASLSLCLRLSLRGFWDPPTSARRRRPGSHAPPGPLLAAEEASRAQLGDLWLLPFSAPWPGGDSLGCPWFGWFGCLAWIPTKQGRTHPTVPKFRFSPVTVRWYLVQ